MVLDPDSLETMALTAPTFFETVDGLISDISWNWVLIIALALLTFRFLFPSGSKKIKLPPSPGAFPIVGSFPLMGAKDGEPAHHMFARLGQKFGPITYLKMGANPVIIISNSEVARLVLKDLDHVFSSRPYLTAGKLMGMDFQSVVFAPAGPHYKRLRKIYNLELLSPKRVTANHSTRENGVYDMLGSIYKTHKQGEVTNLSSLLQDLSLNSLMSMIFGWKDGKMAKTIGKVSMEEVKYVVRQAVELGGEFNFGDYIAIARWLDLQGVIGRMKKLTKVMKEMAAALIEEYERSGKKSPTLPDATILDVILALEGDDKLSPDAMSGVMFDMIIAGSDTTSVSSDWTIAELLRQPKLVRRLQAELDEMIGKESFVTEADVPKLPFLQAVVKESLRLHPPAPLGIPHCSTEDCKLAGYDIPAGTTALVNIWAVNRDPNQWPDPLRFDPDRFLDSDLSVFGTAYHLLPFSSGRRGCPGMLLGLTMVQIIVANLVHSFEFQAAAGLKNEEIDVVNETPGLVSTRAQPLRFNVTPRLPARLFEQL
ncbi:unnamed protein product [Calypogeia fissa]